MPGKSKKKHRLADVVSQPRFRVTDEKKIGQHREFRRDWFATVGLPPRAWFEHVIPVGH